MNTIIDEKTHLMDYKDQSCAAGSTYSSIPTVNSITSETDRTNNTSDVVGVDDNVTTRKRSSLSAKSLPKPSQQPEAEPLGCRPREETTADVTTASALETGTRKNRSKDWWSRTWEISKRFKSVNLKNEGSVARDHLALERTFLAWLRTSLAFASIGVAITQLFRLNLASKNDQPSNDFNTTVIFSDASDRIRKLGKPLGTTFLMISIITLLLGFNRYFEGQHWIIQGKFPASRGSVILMTVITFAMMMASLVVILVLEPTKE